MSKLKLTVERANEWIEKIKNVSSDDEMAHCGEADLRDEFVQ